MNTTSQNSTSRYFKIKNSRPHRALRSLTKRQNAVSEAVNASRVWAKSTARTLTALLAPELRDHETLPDLALLQELVGRALERRWEAANDADARHGRTTFRYGNLLEARAAAVRALYRGVVDLRTLTQGTLGKKAADNFLCLHGPTAREPIVLLRQADRITAKLRETPVPLASVAAEAVAAQAETLRTLVSTIGRTVDQLDMLTLDRQRALADFNTTFVALAGCLEAIYRAVGRPDQALRVRPSRRHPGRLYVDVRKGQRKLERQRARDAEGSVDETVASSPEAAQNDNDHPEVEVLQADPEDRTDVDVRAETELERSGQLPDHPVRRKLTQRFVKWLRLETRPAAAGGSKLHHYREGSERRAGSSGAFSRRSSGKDTLAPEAGAQAVNHQGGPAVAAQVKGGTE